MLRANEFEFQRNLSAGLKGVGAACLTFGGFGLLVPPGNVLVYGRGSRNPSLPA
jgi:hypothetical protein